MDSFELNKIIGAILGTLLFVMGVGFLAEAVYEPHETGPGLSLPEPEGTAHAGEPAEEAAAVPIGVLLASADAAAGENAAKKCMSCHNFAQGAGNKTGPELFGVVGRVEGSHEGFAYSEVMAEHKANGDVWSYENLNAFLHAPKEYAPGTKMNFSGLKNDAERANVIAYLASISPDAPAFPPAEAAAAAAPEGTEPVATDGAAVPTPTETQGETAVEGTPTTSGTEPAAPAATTPAPSATEAPATTTEPAPAAAAPAAQ
jgi:cytochrome c